ncbi:unnamed protein product [Symbiodinium microadriaticum]|nr:unnamed protein product [Symbiodinium microadriaticum]
MSATFGRDLWILGQEQRRHEGKTSGPIAWILFQAVSNNWDDLWYSRRGSRGASLTAIAGEHFGFHSAQEYLEGEEEVETGMPARLTAAESSIGERPAGEKPLAAKAKAAARVPGDVYLLSRQLQKVTSYDGLDSHIGAILEFFAICCRK